jgi:hypothetical protein
MSTDYAQKEREFIASLKSDTGHDLAAWMDRIAAQQLGHRNEIIDWLRTQGFIFAKASWLERIYHNGGEPIYPHAAPSPSNREKPAQSADPDRDGRASRQGLPTAPDEPTHPDSKPDGDGEWPALRLVASKDTSPDAKPEVARSSELKLLSTAESLRPPSSDLDTALLAAKGLRPLARLVLDALNVAGAGVSLRPAGTVIVAASQDMPFAALVLQPKLLRLALNRSGLTSPADFQSLTSASGRLAAAKARIPAEMTHIYSLDDARQIDSGLTELLRETAQAAAARSE